LSLLYQKLLRTSETRGAIASAKAVVNALLPEKVAKQQRLTYPLESLWSLAAVLYCSAKLTSVTWR